MADIEWGEPVITGRVPEDENIPSYWSQISGYWANWWGEDDFETFKSDWSKSETSAKVDKVLAAVEEPAKKVVVAANNWLGYAADPEKIQDTLKTVAVIVVVLGVVYALATVVPLVKPLVSK
jgi:hypothetical protein